MESFSKSVVPRFYPIQSREALTLALALMRSPSALESHLQRHASSIMLSINYHLPPTQSEEDPIVVRAANHARRVLHEIQPGVRLVEYFNWLRYVPSKCVLLREARSLSLTSRLCAGSPNGNGTHGTGSSKIRCGLSAFSIRLRMTSCVVSKFQRRFFTQHVTSGI